MSRRRRSAGPDGLGFPDWLGGLIVSAGSAVVGAVATRIADGGEAEAQREAVNRSLTFQFEAARMQQEQKRQDMFTMVGVGVGAIVLISLLK